jgi:hypothetical protein
MLTYNGGVDISKFSPYAPDGYSIAFAGNSQQLKFATSADFELTGDATVEMWVYLNSAVTGNTPLYGYGNDAGTNYFSLHIAADGRLQWYQHGSLSGIESTASVGIRRWHHIALVKDGTSLKVYNNGKEVISSSYTASFPTGHELRIGSWYNSTNYGSNGHLNGYIADYRVVKGTAVYQGDFTPPTNLTAITNTKLLLSTSSKQIVDISASPKTIIFNGPPSISDWTPFIPKPDAGFRRVEDYGGGSSFYFSGTSYIDASPITAIGTGDYTIEAWVYHTDISGQQTYVSDTYSGQAGIYFYKNNSHQIGIYYTTQIITGSTVLKANQWYHVCVKKRIRTNLFVC